ncbi:triadin isoform X1 [Gadus morhua]|uniref:triadin isoform X1 n=1 Tax=Gadus morhua TaxID=8049 RepID=UPI0011B6BC54|nr:triadin isoform X1 [Gadus morhua]XP_030201381.1 triadin isoform X1 [Gadus morhua]XP_030201382.1 triadin isoform X1 [Gadus morhua]
MSGQTSNGGVGLSPPRSNQRTLMNDFMVTFSSPVAWVLVVALVITWSGVAIVVFDLLDYKTLAELTSYCDDPVCLYPGLSPAPSVVRKALKTRGAIRAGKSMAARAAAEAVAEEETSWLGLAFSFAANLVAPEEEEGIHQLTESITPFHSEEF